MLIIKILFIFLIIACAIFHLLYVWDFSLVALIIVAAIPALMFVTTFITKKLITAELTIGCETAAKNETFPVSLSVLNRSIFPVGKAEAYIEYYNIFNNRINTVGLAFPIQTRNSQRITLQLSSAFCGIINIRSAYIVIYDPLRIFKFKIAKNIRRKIMIYPEGHDIGAQIVSSDRLCDESPVFSEHKPGDDSSEIFDLRSYIPGDKLNRIHWKLSSKKDELIVKEYSFPVNFPTALFLDLRCLENSEYTLPIFDTLIETAVSLSQFLIAAERRHTLIFYSTSEKMFKECRIDNQASLNSAVYQLLQSLSDDLYCEDPEIYLPECSNRNWTSFTFITAESERRRFEFIENNIDADVKNSLFIAKNTEDAVNAERNLGLNVIPIAAGRISASVRFIGL